MSYPVNNRRDILLLLIYSPGTTDSVNEPIAGRTRLVKMLFLFKEEVLGHFKRGTQIDADRFYEFFPWDFGPFSREVYDDLMFFELRGFVATSESDSETLAESAAEWECWESLSTSTNEEQQVSEYAEVEFRLTDRGSRFAEQLYRSLSVEQKELLRQFKKRLNATPLRALLRYVYKNYEEHTTRSRIKGRVLG